jgi:hypothetical protein
MQTNRWLFAALLLLPAAVARGQDVTTGPTKGEKVPALKVYDVTGTNADKEVDYTADRKDKPTVYYLVQADQFDRPMARFMKEMDKAVKKDFGDVYVVAVWLTDDTTKTKEYLPKAQQSLQFEATGLSYFPGDKAGPKDWNVNADARLTVVVANKGKVAAAFGYKSVNETDVAGVVESLKKVIDKK